MNKLLKKMGWKFPHSDRWDWIEIKTDLGFIAIVVIVVSVAVYYA